MKHFLIAIIHLYQYMLRPWVGQQCRFTPTCSHYAIDCLQYYAMPKALGKIIWRLLRCQPWSKGGIDPAKKS